MRRALLLAGIPLVIVAIVVVAWALDVRAHDGKALRNVEVAGRAVGGLTPGRLADVVRELEPHYATARIVVHTPKGDITARARDLGLRLDVDDTVQRALDEGRHDTLPLRPMRWLTSIIRGREAGVVAKVDRSMVRALVVAKDPTGRRDAVEPGIAGNDGQIAVVLGEDGRGLDADAAADAIEAAAAGGDLPIEATLAPHALHPRFTRPDAEKLAARAEKLTSAPIAVTAGDAKAEIPGSIIRSWLRSDASDDGLELALDDDTVLVDLAKLLKDAGSAPEDARFTVYAGVPTILSDVEGKECCDTDAVGFLLGAIKGGSRGPIRLPLRTIEPEHTTAELTSLGVVEEVGSFTTHHKCCENRVANIHRIADLVRGVVIQPGATFSVNEHVGKRTTENGFIIDHVIENGSFATAVGGGVSQFATTTFNAAFFAGLDLKEYQSHSIYISRYPYGREATLSYPKPDLVIRNSTPYGVLIWPTYTDTSLTITMYSTKYVHGEQTAQSEAPYGTAGCKRVTTERTRTYVDGHTKVDHVYAVYRPSEGVQCG